MLIAQALVVLVAVLPHVPGATNPAVTQATIARTICVRGWTATVRPPLSYTRDLKRLQIQALGDPGSVRDYEEDHLIPLELGGAPRNPRNLWPEPWTQARVSDRLEDVLHRQVCSHRTTLAGARRAIKAWKRSLG